MKELSIEQKARAYDEAINKAKSKIKNDKDNVLYEDDIIELFPELKESEDERIRKEIIRLVKETKVTDRYYELNKMLAWLEKQGEQKSQRMVSAEAKEAMYDKPAWSEEDDEMIEAVEALCDDKIRFTEFHDVKEHAYTVKNWLKSLKERIQPQPKQEWSEEDERMSKDTIRFCELCGNLVSANWIKSLRPQNTWKPSEEQMEALKQAKTDACGKPYFNALASLYVNLKGY